MVVEAVAGVLSGSLALVSDAGHMLADTGALALAVVAQRVASRPPTDRRTYGWRRAETLAAFVNGLALGAVAVLIVAESIERWHEPPAIDGRMMLTVAFLGLLANVAAGIGLARGHHNANTNAALAHVVSDALGSVAALVAGALVVWLGWSRADVVASLLVALLVLWSALRLVRQTTSVLLESVPPGLDMAALEQTIRGTGGVADLHDLHAWTISDGFDAVTVHVVLDGHHHGTDVAREVASRVRAGHGITHVTVQPEPPAAEAVVSTDLRNAISEFIDLQFLSESVAATANNPAGIARGVTAIPATGTDAPALRCDIGTALSAMTTAGLSTSGVVIVMSEQMASQIGLMTNALGQPDFPSMGANGGTLAGLRVITSENVGSDTTGQNIYFIKQQEIFLADDGAVSIDSSREATLDMSGSTSAVYSLWQRNAVGIRAERWINYARRREGAVQYISGAAYNACGT
jgi:cobalt-zinc-cadmium efflux system protein